MKLPGGSAHGALVLKLLKRTPDITPETPDGALVRRAQDGESAAFKALFERHVVAVRRFLRDLLRTGDAADDATQETFARAHAQLVKFPDHDRFKPWILGIARNVAFEHMRVRSRTNADPADAIEEGRAEDLLGYRDLAPHAQRNHPTEEHFLPLFAAFGAATPGENGRRIHRAHSFGVLAMDAYRFD